MKRLHAIVTLCIASSFHLNAMEEKKYAGLEMYLPWYFKDNSSWYNIYCTSAIYDYCNPTWTTSIKALLKGKKIDPQNCEIVNAYLLQHANQAYLSNKPQDTITKEQVNIALKNMGTFNQWEADNLEEGIARAQKGNFLTNNQ
jgi:hypothetical protein